MLIKVTINLHSWRGVPEYLTLLPIIRVLILGSYRSQYLNRLEAIRNELIGKGIINARLVKDFKVPVKYPGEPNPIYNLRKSEYWIDRADILLFIYFNNTDNASVGVELTTTLINPGNAWRINLAYTDKTASLVVGLGMRHQPDISLIHYSEDIDIVTQCRGNIIGLLARFFRSVYQRPVGEWENSSII